ncbi:MAG: ribonuclease III [Bacteroidaceae bacterium]|nr:ribonuclease III [Bacteroidaceae bacterium]
MSAINLIDAIKLPFRKEKALCRAFRDMLGFYPHNIGLYQEALMHKSMLAHAKGGTPINNERLEFLGDAVLGAVVGEIVFHHFPRQREGFLTNTRSKIVQRESLGKLATEIGLDKLVRCNEHNQMHNSYLAGNAFEALIGAIYLDRGYSYCKAFITKKILHRLIDIDKLAYQEKNFKSKVLEWCQKHKVTLEFVLLDETKAEDGSPLFNTKVVINGHECARGRGYSKKESQQKASKNALYRLKNDRKLHDELISVKN